MKEQYVGDIGDFGKVLILKHLAGLGFRLGVHWVLTKNDDKNDGKHREYATKYSGVDCLCLCDVDVFEAIRPLAKIADKNERRIGDLESLIRGFAADAVFFKENCDNRRQRIEREQVAFALLNPASVDLVFFDPDNGLDNYHPPSPKHVSYLDLKKYWDRGQSILVYHYLSRNVSHKKQIRIEKANLKSALKGAVVLHFYLQGGPGESIFFVSRRIIARRFMVGKRLLPLRHCRKARANGRHRDTTAARNIDTASSEQDGAAGFLGKGFVECDEREACGLREGGEIGIGPVLG